MLCLYSINMLQYPYTLCICLSSRLLYFPLLHFQFLRDICRPYPPRSNQSCSRHHFNTSIQSAERATAIYSTRVVTYVSTKFVLQSPVTNSSAPEGRLMTAATTSYVVKESLKMM